jgi:two-component system sensor histidine kinase BaeS
MTLVGTGVGIGTLVIGTVAAFMLRSLRSVRQQLIGLALVAVILPLGAVLVSGLVMFHMGNDRDFIFITAVVTTSGLIGAFVLARNFVQPLDTIREASHRLAAGDLASRAPEKGPAELAELGASFNVMAAHLEESFDARRELVAWASHDLRAPITSLQAMLEAIEDGIVEPRHYLSPLQSQVRLLGALVDDLFELACIDSGAVSLEFTVVDMAILASSCAHRFEAEARARGIGLTAVQRGGNTQSHCAPDKIERVLTNLITNSVRYTPPGGRICVAVGGGAGAVFVSVEDTGIGIAPEVADRVFEPFWRADEARSSVSGGAGLGLAIARGLIEAQGGRIWAEPPASGGTRITFVLPASSNGESGQLDPNTIAVARAYFGESLTFTGNATELVQPLSHDE